MTVGKFLDLHVDKKKGMLINISGKEMQMEGIVNSILNEGDSNQTAMFNGTNLQIADPDHRDKKIVVVFPDDTALATKLSVGDRILFAGKSECTGDELCLPVLYSKFIKKL